MTPKISRNYHEEQSLMRQCCIQIERDYPSFINRE